MSNYLEKVVNMFGNEKVNKLGNKKVLVFGLGGVGGYVVEALVRSGIKTIGICDGDIVSESNINRQIIANTKTIGGMKTNLFFNRIKDISSTITVDTYPFFYNEENENKIDLTEYDYIVDAIDSVNDKILIIKKCKELNIPIISSMGTANKIDPKKLLIADISKTNTCPLAKTVRLKLRNEGINHLKCLFSTEVPLNEGESRNCSLITVTATAGLLIASEVLNDLLEIK